MEDFYNCGTLHDRELIHVKWRICMIHEHMSLDRGPSGWVLAHLCGKLNMGTIVPWIEWKFLYQMHHHRQIWEALL